MNAMTPEQRRIPGPTLPWWKVKLVWLVIGGPAVVVVAGIATTVIAVRGADAVVRAPQASGASSNTGALPALQARNHAATLAVSKEAR